MKELENLEFSKQDFEKADDVLEILARIDKIDARYVHRESDQLHRYQPFLISLLLGDNADLAALEVEAMMKTYFLLWEYYKNRKNIKLTETAFEAKYQKNTHFFKFLEVESKEDIGKVYKSDLEQVKSKALLAAILHRFTTRPVLVAMKHEPKTSVLIGVKSLIECFDDII